MKRYFWNVLISLDQLANTLAGGDPDETISSRLAKLNRKGNRVGVIGCKLLDIVDKGHCERVIELDEALPSTVNVKRVAHEVKKRQ
jgi:hypothetical protein